MKKIYTLLALFIAISSSSFAQSTIWTKTRIAKTLVESHESPANNKKLKDGESFIMNNGNVELARGRYKNGVKDSIWNFYGMTGELVQVYDYTNAKLIFNTEDPNSLVHERYLVDTTGLVKPKVSYPKKIGGVNLGFYLLYNEKSLPKEVKDQKESVLMEYVFDISETGKLTGYSINYSSVFYNSENTQSIKDLPADAYEFIPATVNGKPVKSSLIYQIVLNIAQARDRGTYNVPTRN
jgi:hypothetical protein